ncbi:MAG: alpha/beta hydrolase [Chloroflexi bacterium]|nr:alpha/beta hydrolase [Chloroflexota bacterium]
MAKWDWVKEQETTRQETTAGVISGSYSLNKLVKAGLIGPRCAARFRAQTGLADFAWRVFWSKEAFKWSRYEEAMRRAQGFVLFMHGWDSSHAIWEQIPALVCAANPRLVALAPDVNGFGGSPFASDLPAVESCDPAANMSAVESWVDLLNLRSGRQATRRWRTITLVGHSISGAALYGSHPPRGQFPPLGALSDRAGPQGPAGGSQANVGPPG